LSNLKIYFSFPAERVLCVCHLPHLYNYQFYLLSRFAHFLCYYPHLFRFFFFVRKDFMYSVLSTSYVRPHKCRRLALRVTFSIAPTNGKRALICRRLQRPCSEMSRHIMRLSQIYEDSGNYKYHTI